MTTNTNTYWQISDKSNFDLSFPSLHYTYPSTACITKSYIQNGMCTWHQKNQNSKLVMMNNITSNAKLCKLAHVCAHMDTYTYRNKTLTGMVQLVYLMHRTEVTELFLVILLQKA